MSMCRDKTGQWACETLPDERAALEKEIERLTTENRDLYGSIKKLEEIAGVPDAKPKASVQLPTEEDVDKAMSYIQRMFKKFREKLKEFEEPDGKQTQRL
jgi:prefoldin subunit 5